MDFGVLGAGDDQVGDVGEIGGGLEGGMGADFLFDAQRAVDEGAYEGPWDIHPLLPVGGQIADWAVGVAGGDFAGAKLGVHEGGLSAHAVTGGDDRGILRQMEALENAVQQQIRVGSRPMVHPGPGCCVGDHIQDVFVCQFQLQWRWLVQHLIPV